MLRLRVSSDGTNTRKGRKMGDGGELASTASWLSVYFTQRRFGRRSLAKKFSVMIYPIISSTSRRCRQGSSIGARLR
jgi:hypothetical protein